MAYPASGTIRNGVSTEESGLFHCILNGLGGKAGTRAVRSGRTLPVFVMFLVAMVAVPDSRAAAPNDYEQYLLELINRARANPTAEAARYGIDLNEGLAPGTISSAPKPPLALNPNLLDAARAHSQWMIDTDTFSHTGASGSAPGDRMTAAGYTFQAPAGWGENISWSGTTAPSFDVLTVTAEQHEGFFVDAGVTGRGHRVNLMNASFREIGPGIILGAFSGYNAEMITEDFAYTTTAGVAAFLTGVVYNDTLVTEDSFYTPGEGLEGVTITATRAADGATFQTTTWSSGGYRLALPAGTYALTAGGGELSPHVIERSATIAQSNVKVDFTLAVDDPHPLSPVYRFWSDILGGHFYTIDIAERDKLINLYPDVWEYEGPAFYAYAPGDQPAGTAPVYRFWSDALGGHFYTIDATERDKLIDLYADVWEDEGAVYYVYAEDERPAEAQPVYRFWSDMLGHHFYTVSAGERDKLIDLYPDVWTYESVAWYAYP